MNTHVALVLAAGFSTRYGSDKRLSGQTSPLLIQSLTQLLPVYDRTIVVLRHEDEHISKLVQHLNVTIVNAPRQNIGMGVSIAYGCQTIAKLFTNKLASVSIFLADMPYISTNTMTKILQASKSNNIVRPQVNSTLGHPVCFGSEFIFDLSNLTGDKGAVQLINQHARALNIIRVEDTGIIRDIDTEHDWLD